LDDREAMERGEKFPEVFFPRGNPKFEERLPVAFLGTVIEPEISHTGDVIIIVEGSMLSEPAAINSGVIDEAPR